MFRKPTVFVIGAGGSREFGLPIGEGLKETIADKLNFKIENFPFRMISGDSLIFEATQELARADGQEPALYSRKGKFISNALPHGPSIDNFLHFHSSDEALVKVGKLAIARTILEEEHKSDIRFENNDTVNLKRSAKAWLNKFCMMAIEGHTKEQLEEIFKNVRIITFNYDRCIEHYTSHHLERYVGMERPKAQSIAKTLKVIHVYGKPGPLPWETNRNNGVPFGHNPSPSQLIQVAQQIKTFTEGVHEESGQELITETMNWADRIVIMGFSYGDINLQLLLNGSSLKSRRVIAGMAGISSENMEMYHDSLFNGFPKLQKVQPVISMPSTLCAQLISDHEALLKS